MLLPNSNPVLSWKMSIPHRLCHPPTDLLNRSSMPWISKYDVWRFMCEVRRDLRDAADTGDTQRAWALQSTGTTCQGIKMDGGDLLCVVQRMEHNLAQMLSDSHPADWLVSCLLFAARLWFNFWPHNLHTPEIGYRTHFVFFHPDSCNFLTNLQLVLTGLLFQTQDCRCLFFVTSGWNIKRPLGHKDALDPFWSTTHTRD